MCACSLQELCKDLHRKSDVVDDARYDLEVKVAKNEKEVLTFQFLLYSMYTIFLNICKKKLCRGYSYSHSTIVYKMGCQTVLFFY